MTQPQIKNIFFAVLSCFFFFGELILFAILQQYNFYLLLSFFITLLTKNSQKRTLAVPLFLMSIFSYLEMNIFGWCLVYIMPTIMLANYLDQHLRVKVIIPYLLLTFALCLKMILAWYMHNIIISWMHATQIMVYNTAILTLWITIHSYFEKKYPISP
ncbi:MAG: hypothetical protein Q8Q60_00800 [Candidatus Chromulinivorax sp.]|nr:hypothetical protein [Candidatus Chromulinivorax sp.]